MASSKASAHWEGTLQEGTGTVSTASPALEETSVTWKARVGEQPGTTPEELLGAAHAACFCMALSGALAKAGHEPRSLDVHAAVEFGPVGEGFAVQQVKLTLEGDVPGLDEAAFEQFAQEAKEGCPVSGALAGNVEIQLQARLASAA